MFGNGVRLTRACKACFAVHKTVHVETSVYVYMYGLYSVQYTSRVRALYGSVQTLTRAATLTRVRQHVRHECKGMCKAYTHV